MILEWISHLHDYISWSEVKIVYFMSGATTNEQLMLSRQKKKNMSYSCQNLEFTFYFISF